MNNRYLNQVLFSNFCRNFLGSFIAAREIFFVVSFAAVLIAGNLFLAFLQLPTFMLPAHHHQRSINIRQSGIPPIINEILSKLTNF